MVTTVSLLTGLIIGYILGRNSLHTGKTASTVALTTRHPPVPDRRSSANRPREAVLMEKLMTITRGNQGAIERGVTAKRRAHPRANRAELLDLLYHEYLKDRS